MPEQQALTERVPLAEAAGGQKPKGRRFRARIIQGDIQGSSGFYPAEMLKRDAGVFREGLPVFLDHPGATESYDRPERSVRDLAGRLATAATYESDGLYADIEVYEHWAPVIEAMAGDIGMSIRAAGTVEASTQDDIRGPMVTSLTEAASVDFVTAAGAGGKIVALLESARSESELLRQAAEALAPPFKKKGATDGKPGNAAGKAADDAEDATDGGADEDDENADGTKKAKLPAFLKNKKSAVAEARNVGTWFESRIHSAFTGLADDMFGEGRLTRDERISLSSAIGDGLQAFTSRVEADCPHLYQRDIWDDPEPAQAAIAENTTKGAPVSGSTEKQTPPEREAATEVTESAREKDLAVKLAEAQKELAEARKATADELAALKTRLDESDAEKLRLTNDKAARAAVAEALKTAGLHEASHARVVESVCRDLPTVDGGALDTAKLGESIKATIDAENAYVAALAEAAGFGAVRGLGESTSREADAGDIDKQLAEAFAGIGLDEKAALTAAHGRA